MIPNSPVDPELLIWGWPWHGRIESEQQVRDGALTLPSGAQMPCRYPHYNCTYLWDIGLPAPEVETDNPDEQWQSRAILRSTLSAGTDGVWAWYGGAQASSYPIYVPGRGTLRRRTSISLISTSQQMRITTSVTGLPDVTLLLSRAQCGLDLGTDIGSVRIWNTDHSPDGRRSLFLIAPYLTTAFGQVEQFGRAVIELVYTVVEGSFTVSVNVLRRYSDMLAYAASSIQNQQQLDQNTMVQWLDGPERLASEGPPPGNPPSYPPPWTIADRRSYGTRTYTATYETACWAWYNGSSAELVMFRHELLQIETVGGTRDSRNSTLSREFRRTVQVGGTTSALSTLELQQSTGDRNNTNTQISNFAEGVATYQWSESVPFGIDPGWEALAPEVGIDPGATQINESCTRLSNKLVAPRIARVQFAFGAADFEIWVGSALYPGGVDQGRYTIASTETQENRGRWGQGAFNPITGEVVRHLKDRYCTWV